MSGSFRYQKLYEDIFEMMKRRKLNWCELGLAVYLRGKAYRFGNPFFISNAEIIKETGTTEKVLRPLRSLLQTKGILNFDIGNGKRHPTTYYILESVMIPQRVPKRERKGAQMGVKGCPNGNPRTVNNKEKNKEVKQNSINKEEVYRGDMTGLINEVFPKLGVQHRLRQTQS